ncbi:MAG: hypothetical protein QM778_04945 [Myxococcales bacterium]
MLFLTVLASTACGGDSHKSTHEEPDDGGPADAAALPRQNEDAGEPAKDAGRAWYFDKPDASEEMPTENLDTMPWELVPEDQVREACKLDPEALKAADAILNTPWAVVRYGKLCHQYKVEGMPLVGAWSATKTLGALVTGMVAYQTREIPATAELKKGPLSDADRIDHWLDADNEKFTYNKDAKIAHVLAMIAHNTDLSYDPSGLRKRSMQYDTLGTVQINSLSDVLNTAIAQDPARLGANLEEFTQRFLFKKLGLAHSSWNNGSPDKVLAFSWITDVYDMAKVGLLMLRGGVWKGERLLDAEWIYRMTHPSFEDANTGYGYLTWLNSASGYGLGIADLATGPLPVGPLLPGSCAPVALHKSYPHPPLMESPNCGYTLPYTCSQQYDVGVWQAIGVGGQVIQGHPGLDLVVVGVNLTPVNTFDPAMLSLEDLAQQNSPAKLWDALRPAVVNADPTYADDNTAFCMAYGGNNYAPDWKASAP